MVRPTSSFWPAKLAIAASAAIAAVWGLNTWAHSVGQVQTTKFFAPETVAFLKAKALGGSAGFAVGDEVAYIVQFSPVANNATYGANGYITDYIPPGTKVVQASFVSKTGVDVNGDPIFTDVAPNLPGLMPKGWGATGIQTSPASSANFNLGSTYDTTGQCAKTNYSITNGAAYNAGAVNFAGNNCNGMLSTLYADTGIFYSTDARTAQYPPLPTRLLQGLNGYTVVPTRGTQLNPLLGQAAATTHNLWDACMTVAFGGGASSATCNPAVSIQTAANTPYLSGSAVAGVHTGYPLDYTGQIGPWQRIAYSGSRIGDASVGPATNMSRSATNINEGATPLTMWDGGLSSPSLGWSLSRANPLSTSVNAVRWAVGKLTAGQNSYVKITLKITAPLSVSGITNGSEVFGGDASELTSSAGATASSIDNPWTYHVPSVADNNSNLYVQKTPCLYNAAATSCIPMLGNTVLASATVTYQIIYLNTGNALQNTVTLSDILPCQMAASAASVKVGTVTGPLSLLAPLSTITVATPYTTATVAGNCNVVPQTRQTITFPTMTSLAPGIGGVMIINVTNNSITATPTVNTIKIVSAEYPAGVTSNAVTNVGAITGTPTLNITKSSPASTATAGGSVTYTIVVTNTGVSPANTVTIVDFLPILSGGVGSTQRFNYSTLISVTSTGFVTNTAATFATNTAALFGLAPFSTQADAANRVAAYWSFPNSTLTSAGMITLTFAANVGSLMPASLTPYLNDVVAMDGTSTAPRFTANASNTAPITVISALSVVKTLVGYSITPPTFIAANGAGTLPPNATARYQLSYANAGASAATNVVLSDTLPCQISSTSAGITISSIVSGPITATGTTPYAFGVFTGNCPNTRGTFTFPTLASLPAGGTGAVQIDVKLTTPATTSSVVVNDASISATGIPASTSQVQNTVVTLANLSISKTASPTSVIPGGTVLYTITVTNVGTTAAQTITVYDWLPTLASGTYTVPDATRRFSYQTPTTPLFTGITGTPTAAVVPPTQTPYSVGAYSSNQQELSWFFGAQTLAVGASFSIVFTATVGVNVPIAAPPNYYYNNTAVRYYNNQSTAANVGTNVSALANLTVSKTNNVSTLGSGNTTSYTVTVSNIGGPSAAGGTIIKDAASAGLVCSTVTCAVTTGGATCPTALTLGTAVATGSTSFFGIGEAIPLLPANSSVSFVIACSVTATGQ
jgi:uncharacterized repeat protein (TIGR01451 family)